MSKTMLGIFVAALAYIAKSAGVDAHVDEAGLQTTITTIATVIGLGVAYYGRVRQGDIDWLGRRKKPNATVQNTWDDSNQ